MTISISHGQKSETQHKLCKAAVASERHEVRANETQRKSKAPWFV